MTLEECVEVSEEKYAIPIAFLTLAALGSQNITDQTQRNIAIAAVGGLSIIALLFLRNQQAEVCNL